MATTVKIIYSGAVAELDREGLSICRIFVPANCYADSDVFVNGYVNTTVGDKQGYGKSIYATNVDGISYLDGLIPMASTTTKFAQFQRAILAAVEAASAGTTNTGISFDVDGYQEEIYWNQIAPHMVADGFYIKVGTKEYGENPNPS